ncbi:MAG: YegP family protein [Kangiellaceae bacterium]|nr:YegP family protein [Kangiellaceae bacterium]
MAGKFVVSKGKDGKDYFVLKAGNGEVILQSQGYSSSSGCENGIDSVRRNSQNADRFEKKTASDGRFYFVLNASNGQQVGKSQMYKSESGRNNGIESVAKNAPDAAVVEE